MRRKCLQDKYGVAPDVRSYNTVINGHERAGEWREALALAKEMEQADGVSPNVVTFNSVIGACKRAGRSEEALAVLTMVRRKGLQPDVISFNSAISACARWVWVSSSVLAGGGGVRFGGSWDVLSGGAREA